MTCYFLSSLGIGGPASVAGASARQGTSPFLADRDIRHRDARRAPVPGGAVRALGPPRVLGPVPRNAVLGSFHSHRGRSLGLPDLETGLLALFTDFVTGEIAKYGYLAIFVLMLLESACIPIPSEVTMLFGGALVTAPFLAPEQQLEFWLVVLAGTLGNLVGSWLAYWAGYSGGRPLIDRWGRYLLIRPHEVDRAHAWFERRGQAAVFFGRLLPVIRTFISLPAGVVRMPFWRFTVYTVLGLPAMGGRAGVDRRPARRAVGPGGGGHPPVRLGDRRGPPARGSRGSCGTGSARSDARRRRGSRARRRKPPGVRSRRVRRTERRRRSTARPPGHRGTGRRDLRFGGPVQPSSARITQFSPSATSRTCSNPARSYIIRERLCTATESDNAW